MRQSKKEITDRSVVEGLLADCRVGRLATINGDGWPVIKPLNFAWEDGKVYFHSAREGEKIDDISRSPKVCFEVDLPVAYVRAKEQPCQAEYLYRSVIIKGRAHIVTDNKERRRGLELLMRKYQPETRSWDFPEEKLALTAIVRIDPEEVTGKEDLGKGSLRARALELIGRGGLDTNRIIDRD
ncbi:MAG TPA: pyridoxamine 5'-phosphate oxidase family protein [Nitrospirota bacterium]